MKFSEDDILKIPQKYYLANGVPSEFDFMNVGKFNSGTYMIMYNDRTHRGMSYKVVSINQDTLELHYLPFSSPEPLSEIKTEQELYIKA
ncbi:MAG: hypothetical protein NC344_11085 [Bacteroidales bacterium]|nr:hypothetical protein [Bacteroidales bacterium]MCM1148350.1 hypothetical protein [Bacteroidales bacterium]MCM1207023.1 hypothetical protein [Bacillota bacterium]MCM1511293.1 hypothetical protein [Clostridium sp.]